MNRSVEPYNLLRSSKKRALNFAELEAVHLYRKALRDYMALLRAGKLMQSTAAKADHTRKLSKADRACSNALDGLNQLLLEDDE